MSMMSATAGQDASQRMAAERAFVAACMLLFTVSATLTIVWCSSMSAMGEMQMPGGWTMSMTWMRMSGQTWLGAALSFLGMWIVMMAAMMLPSLVPMLSRYRKAVGVNDQTRLSWLTAVVSVAYFAVWTGFGAAAFLLGIALAMVTMQMPAMARAVPVAVGAVVLIAGIFQFTAWKAQQLGCCRPSSTRGRKPSPDVGAAWRYGLRLGLHCGYCCMGLTASLLVIGVMDLRAMAVVTAAITLERLSPAHDLVVKATGVTAIGVGLFQILRAVGVA